MRRLFAIALVAIGVLGCGDSLAPVTTVDGEWYGAQNGYSLSLALAQTAAGEVSGNAVLAGVSGATQATVSGTFTFPDLVLTISPPGFDSFTYTGTMSQTTAKIDGKMNGSGFMNIAISISKR